LLRVSFLGSSGGKQWPKVKNVLSTRETWTIQDESLLIPGGDCLSSHAQNQAGRPNLVPLMTLGIVRV